MKEEGKRGNTRMFSQEESPDHSHCSWAIEHSWGHLEHEDFAQQFYFRKFITRKTHGYLKEKEKEDEERERKRGRKCGEGWERGEIKIKERELPQKHQL